MRQPPGYRPRGQGWMFDMEEWKSRGNYSEIVDCVISRMQMEHLKKRIQEVFGNAEKELIFMTAGTETIFFPAAWQTEKEPVRTSELCRRSISSVCR